MLVRCCTCHAQSSMNNKYFKMVVYIRDPSPLQLHSTCVSRHAGSVARSLSTSFDAPMRFICSPMQSYTLPFWDLRKGAPPGSSYISGTHRVASKSNAINLGRHKECIGTDVQLIARDLNDEFHAMNKGIYSSTGTCSW